jgi:hypothetical protein
MKLTLLTALAVAFVVISLGQSPESQIVRLSPAAFPDLPGNLVQELQRRQCTIPQETFSKNRNNVIKGEFARPGQTDWAALCSVNGVSTILVFWNGYEKNPATLASVPDNGFVQFLGRDQWGYSRGIEAVGKDYIMRHYEAHGGLKPPPIDHQGINDVFIEKASVVLYLYEGQWLKLAGAD